MKSTLVLLRFPFSLFLLPVFLFALSQAQGVLTKEAWLVFFILHLLVYPSSNGYNSYMDNDEGPIGGLKEPPKADISLFYTTVVMDTTAILLSCLISYSFALGILLYILVSRAYSFKGVRLKKYPYLGFITVVIFQGAFMYLIVYCGLMHAGFLYTFTGRVLYAALASSFLLGAVYPLTQIYQHKADAANGDITISYKLGYMGTFAFSAAMFAAANGFLFVYFNEIQYLQYFWLLQVINFPTVLYFLLWWRKVWKNNEAADFSNTMWMNVIASACLNIYFAIMLLFNP